MITIIISTDGDPRIANLLDSIDEQTTKPDEVIIIAKHSKTLEPYEHYRNGIKIRSFFMKDMNLVQSRNFSIELLDNSPDHFVLFLDTDEVVRADYVKLMIYPLKIGYHFTFGRQTNFTYRSYAQRYLFAIERNMYENMDNDSLFPFGSFAITANILKEFRFNELYAKGAEDWDFQLNLRNKGYRGLYVPFAFYYHNHDELTFYRLLHKRLAYMKETARVYLSHGNLVDSFISSRQKKSTIPYDVRIIETVLKIIALCEVIL